MFVSAYHIPEVPICGVEGLEAIIVDVSRKTKSIIVIAIIIAGCVNIRSCF
jgi:hypothetical protein